ncbi:MAG: sugar phosphate nucleotidyltransferase [Monoglobales bacterium]
MKAIILAAGKGKRLLSETMNMPKVLRLAAGKPLIGHVLDNIDFIDPKDIVIVAGYKREMVFETLGDKYTYAVQDEQKGTGHAVMMAKEAFKGYNGDVIILYGDMPLFKKETYKKLVEVHKETGADCTILTGITDDRLAYGRIIRVNGEVSDIVEDKDCTPEQKEIKELNVGVYVFKSDVLFNNLDKIKNNNAQGEYYLTDIPKILIGEGKKIASYTTNDGTEILGVNTPEDLELCEKILGGNNNV